MSLSAPSAPSGVDSPKHALQGSAGEEEVKKIFKKLYEKIVYNKHDMGEFGEFIRLAYALNFISDSKDEVKEVICGLIAQVRAEQKAEDNNRVVQAQINTVEAEYDALYNLLPTGNVDAWHLLKALQAHLVRLQDMSKELRSYLTNPQESKQ